MIDVLVRAYIWQATLQGALRRRVQRDERGEGVISAAIAVLVMAFLGVLMWGGFKLTLGKAQSNVDGQITEIGK
jgi:hypothetical protein